MSRKSRVYDETITRVLTDAGASVMDRTVAANSHRVVIFSHRGVTKSFHYENTGDQNGSGLLNLKCRLRRVLRDIENGTPARSDNCGKTDRKRA